MVKNFWRSIDLKISLIGLFSICGLVICLAATPIKDIDIWLHLAMGRFIVQNLFSPTVDILSCTINGQPWVNHEWLFQWIISVVHALGGFKGLILFRIAVALSIFIVLMAFDWKILSNIFTFE